jgi:hypothetical protein
MVLDLWSRRRCRTLTTPPLRVWEVSHARRHRALTDLGIGDLLFSLALMTAPSPGFLRGGGGLSRRARIWGVVLGKGMALTSVVIPSGVDGRGWWGGKVSLSVGVSALGFEALLRCLECRQGYVMESGRGVRKPYGERSSRRQRLRYLGGDLSGL